MGPEESIQLAEPPRTGTEGSGQRWPPAHVPEEPELGVITVPELERMLQTQILQGSAQSQGPPPKPQTPSTLSGCLLQGTFANARCKVEMVCVLNPEKRKASWVV